MVLAGNKLKATSISFPSFTNRKFKVPLSLVCNKMFETFIEYGNNYGSKTTLNQIQMVVASERARIIFEDYFKKSANEFKNRVFA